MDMARKKVSTPMLEAFLRETPDRSFGVMPGWIEWAGSAAVLFGLLNSHFLGFLATAILTAAVWGLLHFIRDRQIARLDLRRKIEFEKWTHVARLRAIITAGAKLSSYLPGAVAEELEACARARFHALEELRLGEDPVSVEQIKEEMDAELAVAIASAAIVTRRDDQAMGDVKRWEQDEALLAPIVQRIAVRRQRLEALSVETRTPDMSALRDNLARAKAEREAAERELDESLRQM